MIKDLGRVVGKSAYEIACDNGFVGSEQEWLESLDGSNYDDTELKQILATEIEERKDADTQIENSIETTVNNAISEIVANSPADFDTLKEIADWIDTHEDSASAMNTAIQKNKNALNNKSNYHITSMVDLGFTSKSHVSVREFWNKLHEMFGNNGVIQFAWSDANASYVGTTDTNVFMNGGTLIYTSNGKPNITWRCFSAIFFQGYGNGVYQIRCSIGDDTTEGNESWIVLRLANLVNLNDYAKKSDLNGLSVEGHSHSEYDKTIITKSDGTTNAKYYLIAKTLGTNITTNIESLYINGSDYKNFLFEAVIRTRDSNTIYNYGKDNPPISFYLQNDGSINIYWKEITTYNRVVLDLKNTPRITTYTGELVSVDTPTGTLMNYNSYDWKRFTPDERTLLNNKQDKGTTLSTLFNYSDNKIRFYWYKILNGSDFVNSKYTKLKITTSSDENYAYDAEYVLDVGYYASTTNKCLSVGLANLYKSNLNQANLCIAIDKDFNIYLQAKCEWSSYAFIEKVAGNVDFITTRLNYAIFGTDPSDFVSVKKITDTENCRLLKNISTNEITVTSGSNYIQATATKSVADKDGNDITITYATKAELSGKSDTSHTHSDYATKDDILNHTHNDTYYTETEIDNLLKNKSDTSHTHSDYASKTDLNDKVDKVYGKQLSTNDFTNTDKSNLDTLKSTVSSLQSTIRNLQDKIDNLEDRISDIEWQIR